MQLQDHQQDEKSKKVWLTAEEVDQLLEAAKNTEQRIAFNLGARCGLRTHEIVDVSPTDIVDGPAGKMVRVWQGKGSKYRETPVPRELETTITVYSEQRPEGMETDLVPRSERTLRNWIERAADRCRAATSEEAWRFVTMHDLRRTWGTLLLENDVEPGMVMQWGGWEDWKTFREHYLGVYSPKKQREERGKVDWLG